MNTIRARFFSRCVHVRHASEGTMQKIKYSPPSTHSFVFAAVH
ncbi:hypothetical protein HMPREF0742_01731 [Rothia aeria F0184]|uniref:Uncharacterized protein n=1 Tax=Rothia aeria F0184 TaxID=888019 RepID=U7V374_9MICC|nr:hypothetical protein HMPREF0742_01731 [Rothia aeria F0184]